MAQSTPPPSSTPMSADWKPGGNTSADAISPATVPPTVISFGRMRQSRSVKKSTSRAEANARRTNSSGSHGNSRPCSGPQPGIEQLDDRIPPVDALRGRSRSGRPSASQLTTGTLWYQRSGSLAGRAVRRRERDRQVARQPVDADVEEAARRSSPSTPSSTAVSIRRHRGGLAPGRQALRLGRQRPQRRLASHVDAAGVHVDHVRDVPSGRWACAAGRLPGAAAATTTAPSRPPARARSTSAVSWSIWSSASSWIRRRCASRRRKSLSGVCASACHSSRDVCRSPPSASVTAASDLHPPRRARYRGALREGGGGLRVVAGPPVVDEADVLEVLPAIGSGGDALLEQAHGEIGAARVRPEALRTGRWRRNDRRRRSAESSDVARSRNG